MTLSRPLPPTIAVAALLLLAGCAASTPSTSGDPAPAAPDAPADEQAFADSWLATAAEQFANSQDPAPTFRLSSETAVEFTFPTGSVSGTDARADCQIAMISIGEEYDLTMTYPDGSVLCSDILG